MDPARPDASARLRAALRANAFFSAASGIALAAGAGLLAPWLGIEPTWLLALVGLGLLPFAFALFRNAGRPEVNLAEARIAVGADVAWVVGSAALIAFDPLALTPAGKLTVAAIALCVADFAVWQTLGLGRLRPATARA